jgi:hypothetical protein
MSRANVGHRPVIHSPHWYPSRTAGFRRPRRPCGLRGLSSPRKPGPEGRPVEGSKQRGSVFGAGHAATARCGTGAGAPLTRGGRPRGLTRAILNTGHGASPWPPALWGCLPAACPCPPPGATIRGTAQGEGCSRAGGFQLPRPATLTASRFDGVTAQVMLRGSSG